MPDLMLKHFLIGTNPSIALKSAVRQALRLVNPEVLSERIRAVLDCDAREDLAQMKIPVMYIQADYDRLVRASCFTEVQRFRPDSVLVKLPAPHLVLQTEPQKAVDVIMKFISQLPE